MSITTSEMTPADIRACTCGNDGYNNGGMFGGDGAWWIIILLLFGWGGRGGYSRDSAKEHMIGRIEDMIEETDDPKTKRALERCVQAIENA